MGSFNSSTSGPSLTPLHSDCVIDSHMHIMSGHCTPPPLIWEQTPGLLKFMDSQDNIDWGAKLLSKSVNKDSIEDAHVPAGADNVDEKEENKKALSAMRTEKIGAIAVIENTKCYSAEGKMAKSEAHREPWLNIWGNINNKKPIEKFDSIFSPMITAPMDMEYAHVAGFEKYGGKLILYKTDKWYSYKKRKSWSQKYDEMETKEIPKRKLKDFQQWKMQIGAIESVVTSSPWKILPLYHFEPRRWRRKSCGMNSQKGKDFELFGGSWDYPFDLVASRTVSQVSGGPFIGFKMYPPLGYSPADFDLLPYLEEYYKKCIAENIPILVHCSGGGIRTHEDEFYLEGELDTGVKAQFKGKPVDYLYKRCVHPRNWRRVLERPGLGNLRVCLAHFGGELWKNGEGDEWIVEVIKLMRDYENVFTDLSCFRMSQCKGKFIEFLLNDKNQDLFDRILFGTDWWMTTLSGSGGKQYDAFSIEMKEMLDSVDMNTKSGSPDKNLWVRFSLINPVKFWGLDRSVLLENLNSYFTFKSSDSEAITLGFERMSALREEVVWLDNRIPRPISNLLIA